MCVWNKNYTSKSTCMHVTRVVKIETIYTLVFFVIVGIKVILFWHSQNRINVLWCETEKRRLLQRFYCNKIYFFKQIHIHWYKQIHMRKKVRNSKKTMVNNAFLIFLATNFDSCYEWNIMIRSPVTHLESVSPHVLQL